MFFNRRNAHLKFVPRPKKTTNFGQDRTCSSSLKDKYAYLFLRGGWKREKGLAQSASSGKGEAKSRLLMMSKISPASPPPPPLYLENA